MVIKLYISGISGNKEVKKKQQRVQMILDSKQISYEAIDITEPGKEKDKEFMQQNGKVRESLGKYPLPPQIFNDDDFCGDYEDFDLANEVDELEKFLHIETNSKDLENESKEYIEKEKQRKKSSENPSSTSFGYNPYDYHTYKINLENVNGLEKAFANITNSVKQIEELEEKNKEVNGEAEAVPTSELSTENTDVDKSEPLTEVPKPENEETSKEKETSEEVSEEKNEENVTNNKENEVETEEQEKETEEEKKEDEEEGEKKKEEEEVENKEETEVDKPNDEPHLEEEENNTKDKEESEEEKDEENKEEEEEEEDEEKENPSD